MCVVGGVDTHRPSDDPDHPPSRDITCTQVQRESQSEHVAAPRDRCPAGGQGVLHVSGQHQPDD